MVSPREAKHARDTHLTSSFKGELQALHKTIVGSKKLFAHMITA